MQQRGTTVGTAVRAARIALATLVVAALWLVVAERRLPPVLRETNHAPTPPRVALDEPVVSLAGAQLSLETDNSAGAQPAGLRSGDTDRAPSVPRSLPLAWKSQADANRPLRIADADDPQQTELHRIFNRALPFLSEENSGNQPATEEPSAEPPSPDGPSAPDEQLPADEQSLPTEGLSPAPGLQFPIQRERIRLSGDDDSVHVGGTTDRVTLVAREAPLNKVLAMLAQHMRFNVVISSDVSNSVSITLKDVPLEDALDSILGIAGHTWTRHRDIVYVTSSSSVSNLAPETQGRQVRVFPLNYALASDIEPVVRGLLSPVGKIFYTQTSTADNRKTQESLVVEDLPGYVDRVARYLVQADVPPRQVQIEAHILKINLKNDLRHGVNLKYLTEISGKKIQFELRGMANAMAGQAALFTFEGADLKSLVELLQTTTDAKTLASPRVLVVNGQEARIQVGQQLGFKVTTTTQTSTLESVNFLDVGVVLRVTPRIGPRGAVLMHVKPEVSSGAVNPNTGLPEEETTEVETDILVPDGKGIIIGGLIREDVSDVQNKLPILGDVPLIGRLFQHRDDKKDRSEIVIALVPRIVPFDPQYDVQNEAFYERTTTPLLDCEMKRLPRDDGFYMHDAVENPIRLFPLRRLPPIEEPEWVEEPDFEPLPEAAPTETPAPRPGDGR